VVIDLHLPRIERRQRRKSLRLVVDLQKLGPTNALGLLNRLLPSVPDRSLLVPAGH